MIARTTFDTIKGIAHSDVLVNVHQWSRLVQEVVKDQDIQFQKGTLFVLKVGIVVLDNPKLCIFEHV